LVKSFEEEPQKNAGKRKEKNLQTNADSIFVVNQGRDNKGHCWNLFAFFVMRQTNFLLSCSLAACAT
jgi:hypothetical protein